MICSGGIFCLSRQRGFTFFELIVAVFIFSIVMYGAWIGIKVVTDQQIIASQAMERVREIQHAVGTLVRDFAQLTPRPVRDRLGDAHAPALRSDARTQYIVELTRAGWSNHIGLPRGTLQRVAYRFEENTLYRDHLVVLDATLANLPVETELLTGIENIEIRFLEGSNEWVTQWPPLRALSATGPVELRMRPVAVEIIIELEDFGEVRRLLEISG